MSCFSAEGTNSSNPDPLAGFEDHFKAGIKRGEGKGGGGKEMKERAGEKLPPRNKFLFVASVVRTGCDGCVTLWLCV